MLSHLHETEKVVDEAVLKQQECHNQLVSLSFKLDDLDKAMAVIVRASKRSRNKSKTLRGGSQRAETRNKIWRKHINDVGLIGKTCSSESKKCHLPLSRLRLQLKRRACNTPFPKGHYI